MIDTLKSILLLVLAVPFCAYSDPVVIEAEHAERIELNYEIHRHDGASGGLAISTKEGAGGDFPYYETPLVDINIGKARYTVEIPEDGTFHLGVRAFWMDKCGNQVWAQIDNKKAFHISSPDKAPDTFKRWYWEYSKKPLFIRKGTHTIELHVGEDGSAIDQIALFKPGEIPENPAPEHWTMKFKKDPPVLFSVSITKPTEVIDKNGMRTMSFWVRKLKHEKASGKLGIRGPKDMKVLPGDRIPFSMDKEQVLKRIDVTLVFPEKTPRAEKKVFVTVTDQTGTVACAASCIIARPYDWYITGPFPPVMHSSSVLINPSEIDLDTEPVKGKKWQKLPRKAINPYQTIDFEQVFGQAVSESAYLYTQIDVPGTGQYIMLINNDGAVKVWIDGKERFSDFGHHPAAGWLKEPYIHLAKGVHSILVLCEQNARPEDGFQANYWLFRVRFRKRRTVPSDISGVECVKKQ